jgi:hypothetical protein
MGPKNPNPDRRATPRTNSTLRRVLDVTYEQLRKTEAKKAGKP